MNVISSKHDQFYEMISKGQEAHSITAIWARGLGRRSNVGKKPIMQVFEQSTICFQVPENIYIH